MGNAHYRVVIRTEKLDEGGNVEDVVSEDVLADFPDDQDEQTEGQQSNDYHCEIVRKR